MNFLILRYCNFFDLTILRSWNPQNSNISLKSLNFTITIFESLNFRISNNPLILQSFNFFNPFLSFPIKYKYSNINPLTTNTYVNTLFSLFNIREDYLMAQRIPEKSRDFFYNNIKAGAESGWDFSNRWFIRNNNSSTLSLYNISTQYIIPVDLNAILQQNARLLGEFHTLLGNNAVSCETFVDKHTALKFIR